MLKKPVEAVLFDMDGLLLDTEAVYIVALQAAARTLGREWLDRCHSMIGVPARECNVMIQAFYGDGFQVDAFRQHYSGHARRLLETSIPLKPGVVELLDFLAGRGLPLAVATSAGRTRPNTISAAPACSTASARWPRATTSSTPSRIPTSISRRRAGWAWRPSAASPSRIRTSASAPPMPPAPWPSWCPTSSSRCPKSAPSAWMC